MTKINRNDLILILFCVLIAIIGRIIPHPPNVTPLLGLIVLMTMHLSLRGSLIVVAIILFISDSILSVLKGYPFLGSWMIATYSGFILVAIMAYLTRLSRNTTKNIILQTMSLSLFYWLWSNFFVWIFSAIYSFNVSGLISCYTAAIPFLRNSLLGDLTWTVIIFSANYYRYQANNLLLSIINIMKTKSDKKA